MITLPLLLSLAAGLVLLFAGRKVFWLAAGLVAFLFTYNLLMQALGEGPVSLVIAAVVGFILAGLAIRFVRLIGFLVGALAGAVGLPLLLRMFGYPAEGLLVVLLGAVVGIVVIGLAFELGLVVMTAWIGANTVTTAAGQVWMPGSSAWPVIFIVLLVLGVLVQLGGGPRGGSRHRS